MSISPHAVWILTLALCLVWITGGLAFTLFLPGRDLLLTVPAVILARVAWRHLRRA